MALHATSTTPPRFLYAALPLVACITAAGVYLAAPGAPAEQAVARAAPAAPSTPSAKQFANNLVGAANAFAEARGDRTRIGNADCVQAAPGRYMCSYASKRPGAPAECHVMQGRWTPDAESTITVTLAGRAGRCGSLREALRSLT